MSYILPARGITLSLAPCGEGIVRITRTPEGVPVPAVPSAVVTASPEGDFRCSAGERDDLLSMPGLTVRVRRDTGALAFFSPSGSCLLGEADDPFEVGPAVSPRSPSAPGGGVRGFQAFTLTPEEALYGLGAHEEGYGNLRGKKRLLYQHNRKAVVPVLVSTAGWGILFHMGCAMRFEDTDAGMRMEFDCAEALDWFFFCSDTYAGLMGRYRALTGPCAPLPAWALGYIQSRERYTCADELTDVVRGYRRRGIPLDMVVLDWQSWPEGQWGYKTFDRARFPEGFIDRLHDMGVRLMVSVWPCMSGDSNGDLEEMRSASALLGDGSTYNAFSPEARDLYWRQASRLYHEGTDAFWCDATEPFDGDWEGEEEPGSEERMRLNTRKARMYLDPAQESLFSLYHAMGMYEHQKAEGAGAVFTLTRSSWAGQHRYGAVTWSGDVCATWETLRRQVPEALNFFATGEAYFSCDIGGFFTSRRKPWFWKGDFPWGMADPGYRELYVRWLQFGCFLTLMRSHGTDTPREIWQLGEAGDPFYDAAEKAIRLRYALRGRLQELLEEAVRTGVPPQRVPALVFPGDTRLRREDHLMMLGDSLLFCPVTRPMYYLPGGTPIACPDETVEVCFPAGCAWRRWGTQTVYEGGTRQRVRVPLSEVALFERLSP